MEPEELTRIYDDYAETLFRFLLTLTQHDETRSRDLLQDIFVRLIQMPTGLAAIDDEKNCLFRMCRNVTVDGIRQSGSRRTRHAIIETTHSPFYLSEDPDAQRFQVALESALNQSANSRPPETLAGVDLRRNRRPRRHLNQYRSQSIPLCER
ncbi:MAG: DNA-directed RNA polymerase specialized sigma24 family protein [Verrucomicrobiales bacterium]|jgi:DNA-directed RNA polymerase specialized sigma24 family protein